VRGEVGATTQGAIDRATRRAGRHLGGAGHVGDGRERSTSEPDAGQGTVEYAVILGGLAVAAIVSLLFVGAKIDGLFRKDVHPSTFRPPPVTAVCNPGYSGWCVPSPPPDLDCDDLDKMGAAPGEVKVVGIDEHGLDPDGDGIACNE
jgi:hypothetical protein